MSDNIESLATNANNDPSVSDDDSAHALPDLDAWMNEIEEFVAEITNDLNEIGKSLGDRTLVSSTKIEKTSPAQPPSESSNDSSDQDNDRLGSLKRRLANLNSEPAVIEGNPATTWDAGANTNG